MKKICAIFISGMIACCALSCKDEKAKNNFFLLPASGSSTTDNSTAIVPCGTTDATMAAADAANLSVSAITFAAGETQLAVKGNFTLPVAGACGSTISWISSNTSVVSVGGADATVTRPSTLGSGDVAVKLLATATRGTSTASREFEVTVVRKSWVQDAYLKASNANIDRGYGSSVAISGDTIAVGAQGESSRQATITNTDGAADTSADLPSAVYAGAVYVYKKDASGDWIQDAYLRPSNPNTYEMMGSSVAMSGDIIVAGAFWDDTNQSSVTNDDGHPTVAESSFTLDSSGAAYVFKRDASGNWIQDAFLKASNAESYNGFGISVAVDSETIVVGATGEESNNTIVTSNTIGYPTGTQDNESAPGAGATYVFKKDVNGGWYQAAFLKASNAGDGGIGDGDSFGVSVSISGDIIAVGAYDEDSNSTIVTNANSTTAGSDSGSTDNSGAVYVFKKDTSGNWVQDAYLKASNGGGNDLFGSSVAVNGDTIVVGTDKEDGQSTIINANGYAASNNDLLDSGAVYVFRRQSSGTDPAWYQDAYLKASNAGESDGFGRSVAVNGDTIAVSSTGEDSGQSTITNDDGLASDDDTMIFSGAVYVFKRDTSGNWVQDAYLKASNNPASIGLGTDVAISGTTIVSSALPEGNTAPAIVNTDGHPTAAECTSGSLSVGAAYVFTIK